MPAIGRTAALQVVKLGLILCPILLAACATGYHPAGSTAGYTEKQLSRNVFRVGFGAATRIDDSRATDLCLLRCAEVTLAHGFSHFVVLEGGADLTSPEQTATNGSMTTRSTSGHLTYVSAQTAKPSSLNTIACFRRQPPSFPDARDAQALRDQLALQYHMQQKLGAPAESMEAYTPQFDLYPSFLLLPKTAPDHIVFLEPSTLQRSFLIGELTEWENPCATLDEFKRKAAAAAAILGGQAILIRDGNSSAGPPDHLGSNVGFTAELRLVPKAQLGIQDEDGAWPRKEMVIRGFAKDSLAQNAGLKVGDRIIALNGTDVLRQKRFVDCWLAWTVGEDVVVTFVRDGTEMTTQAKTIAN